MTDQQRALLKYVGFPVFYLFALLVFVRLTFPYQTLRNRILAEYNRSQEARFLEIDNLVGSGLFGVKANGIRLMEVFTKTEQAEAGPPKMLVLDQARVGFSPVSYLLGAIAVAFDAEVGGGAVDGTFRQDAELAHIRFVGDSVDISGLTMLSAGLGLPLGGELEGTVDLTMPDGQMSKSDGNFDLKVLNFSAGDGKAKIRDTIALPKLSAGNLVLLAEAKDGRLEIEEFSANGRDFKMDAQGKLRLRQPFDKSSVSIDATFRFKDAYTTKSDITKSLFGEPGSKVPGLFDMDPTVRKAKQADGTYAWHVSGLVAKPNFTPTRKSGSAPTSQKSAKPGAGN